MLTQPSGWQAMGNCVTCRESAPSPEKEAEAATAEGSTTPTSPTHLDSCEGKDLPPLPVKSSQGESQGQTVIVSAPSGDFIMNGNAKSAQTTEPVASLHRERSLRMLCSRIPPLTRGGSGATESQKQKEISEQKRAAMFDSYADPDNTDLILAEGMERLLIDLSLSPDEFKVLVLAWKLNAERMCQFSREEFMTGLRTLRADSLSSLNSRLNEVCQQLLRHPSLFKDLYRFTFRFGLDVDERLLPTEMAVGLWRIVFSLRPCSILERWLDFLEKEKAGGIPKDTWNMFLYLTDQLGDDLSRYDDSHAWPTIFDDFVEHENDRVNQNVAKDRSQIIPRSTS